MRIDDDGRLTVSGYPPFTRYSWKTAIVRFLLSPCNAGLISLNSRYSRKERGKSSTAMLRPRITDLISVCNTELLLPVKNIRLESVSFILLTNRSQPGAACTSSKKNHACSK